MTLDDRLRTDWDGLVDDPGRWYEHVPDGDVVRGVRFARNRVHHQWADAIELPGNLADEPLTRGQVHEWVWRWPLPDGRPDGEGERIYRDVLAGDSVLESTSALMSAFAAGVSRVRTSQR